MNINHNAVLKGINVILMNFFRTTAQVNKEIKTKIKKNNFNFHHNVFYYFVFWFFKDENYKTYFYHHENESQLLNKIKF